MTWSNGMDWVEWLLMILTITALWALVAIGILALFRGTSDPGVRRLVMTRTASWTRSSREAGSTPRNTRHVTMSSTPATEDPRREVTNPNARQFHTTSRMFHPIRAHGHTLGLSQGGACKDTVIVRHMQNLAVDRDADDPTQWATHRHDISPAEAGMMTRVSYRA